MTRAEAAATIGRRVRVTSGFYRGLPGTINHVYRKLVSVHLTDPDLGAFQVNLSPFRLHLIDEPKEEANANP